VQDLARRLEIGEVLSYGGIDIAAQPFLAVLLRHLLPDRTIVVVTEGLKTQESFQADINTWLVQSSGNQDQHLAGNQAADAPAHRPSAPPTLFFPAWEVWPHESRLPHVDVISERLEALVALKNPASPPLIVTSVAALLQRTFPRADLERRTRTISRRDRVDPLDLVEWLEAQGYEPEAQASQPGEIALRGGILDVFPLTSPYPIRLEFFGDELESLRFFDPVTQISREETTSVTLAPAGEMGLLKQASRQAPQSAPGGPYETVQAPGLPENRAGAPVESVHPDVQEFGTLLDYLPKGTIFLLCEPGQLADRAQEHAAQVPAGDPLFIDWATFRKRALSLGMATIQATGTGDSPTGEILDLTPETGSSGNGATRLPASDMLEFESLEAFRPLTERPREPQVAEVQRREFFNQIHRWLRQDYSVNVFCNNDGERQRFAEVWSEYGLEHHPPVAGRENGTEPPPEDVAAEVTEDGRKGAPIPQGLHAQIGSLSRGFIFHASKLIVITDAEIFGRYKVQRPRRLKSPRAQLARSALDIDFADLEEGDYVVHLQHGIGRYLGLQVLPVGAGTKPVEGTASTVSSGQECLVIEYAPSNSAQPAPKLYVPVTEAHLVSKYIGTGKARPPLNALGGTRWAKAKAHAERAVRDVASDLLAIQAARESQAGHACAPDVPWQREFESAFLFEETPDQMRAILETKADMERPKPMDRLICGDVGFGKTEVAIRAAFKAVMDGRQVAILVPTTVLAQQHYNTFRERMADYPVRIELLSRFRTRRAQTRVVSDLATGAVDMVIGTHRLLQNDIAFKDLGLVVIDEEQRFGVLHKEKFKMLRRLVDVLTLSATPIPRTLYLALTGARDMSTIQTPPHDRLPVDTIVAQYDERVIRDAIQRELNRGGQVFFLHNRVATIETMAQKLKALVPRARMVVGHGQMHSDDLEEVMTQFVNGEADILLSTTIIESGLDIPNANTIIIDRADRFGLSDLYQLRGRVGRYKHQAYAYLLLPRHAGLLADVRKRLSAIKQYSTLGSGFKIAMRDLEIRGAGNLLGSQQSGHITAVGFELYCQLLKQSVASLKGEKVKPRIEVQIRLDFLALSPVEERGRHRSTGLVPEPARRNTSQKMEAVAATTEGEVLRGQASGLSRFADRQMPETPDVSRPRPASGSLPMTSASIPFSYISDSRQRIDVYRKLAQAADKPALQNLTTELRDRFGPLPRALELLIDVAEMRILAAERGVTAIEVKEDKLMLTRNNDYVMVGTKFPRLTRKEASARLKEIRKVLLAIQNS